MRAPLSHSEMEALDHQMDWILSQVDVILTLLESRLGQSDDLVTAAASLQNECERFARQVQLQKNVLIVGSEDVS